MKKQTFVFILVNSFGVKFSSNKLSLGKKLICKIERLNVKLRKSGWPAHDEPSHLDLCCLQNPIFIACGSERVKYSDSQTYAKSTDQISLQLI